MKLFEKYGNEISYKDGLQLDGAFSVTHINYGKSPIFAEIDSREMTKSSMKNSLSLEEKIEDVIENLYSFNGTEKDFKINDRIELWKSYWLEYINAFDKLNEVLPDSVVTAYIGRQAIEIGFKYLLFTKTRNISKYKTHDLGKLSREVFAEYVIEDDYMNDVDSFCEKYSDNVEGGNVEYFRFPEYKCNSCFAGNRLDISWLSYNFALILLKLLHLAELEY